MFCLQGNILSEGSYQELQSSGLDFMKSLGSSEESVNEPKDETDKTGATVDSNDLESFSVVSLPDSVHSTSSYAAECQSKGGVPAEPVEIAEARTAGKVSRNVYLSYILAGGNALKILFLISVCIFTQVLCTGCDFWISYWYSINMFTCYLCVFR